MKAMDALKAIMEVKDVKPSVLADRIGISRCALSERFTQKNVSVAKLGEMLRVLDYKIVLVPRNARIPDGGFEIE